jgi:hypothetical protein
MSKKHKSLVSKKPRAEEVPCSEKRPRVASPPNDNGYPQFQAELDMEGPFGWQSFDPKDMQDLLAKIFELQRYTWQELRAKGSHLVSVEQFSSIAQKRLREISKDDLDELYSLRLTGKKRIWGIKSSNILRILWWDPEHRVCPSHCKDN